MTYNVKMDTNNGHITFEGKADYETPANTEGSHISSTHRELAKKFFSVEQLDNS